MSLFMLFVAPVAIIAVAGFSLSAMFGVPRSGNAYLVALIDDDHGPIATAIETGLNRQAEIRVVRTQDLRSARQFIIGNAQAPLAIQVPAGTSSAFDAGKPIKLYTLTDPVKRLQASAVELRFNDISQDLGAIARARLMRQFDDQTAELRSQIQQIDNQWKTLDSALNSYRRRLREADELLRKTLRAQLESQIGAVRHASELAAQDAARVSQKRIEQEIEKKNTALTVLNAYLDEVQKSRGEFEGWFERLNAAAAAHSVSVPEPPSWPPSPDPRLWAELKEPMAIPIDMRINMPNLSVGPVDLELPELHLPDLSINRPAINLVAHQIVIPGTVSWVRQELSAGRKSVNAFDQYVPGFGITFLLIDMIWGLSVGLIDEREWGTLGRLRVSGASTSGMLIGRIGARSFIGFLQLIVLFAIGWLLFDISVGKNAAALLLPAAAIAFAAASFGLVVACVAPTRDSALAAGAVAAMVMSAAGGCWWPVEFEPSWMRQLAQVLPTTWAMHAFDNLMIRGLEASAAVVPTTVVFALGVSFLLAGVGCSHRLYR